MWGSLGMCGQTGEPLGLDARLPLPQSQQLPTERASRLGAGARPVWASHLDLINVSCSPSGSLLRNVPSREAAKSSSCRRSGGLQTCRAESTPQVPPPAPCGPRPKPKTVSELLREKRLREARARKAAQGPAVLPPQLLVSSPLILQPPLPLASQGVPATGPTIAGHSAFAGPGAAALASPSTSGPWASAEDKGPLALQTLAIAPAPTEAVKAPASPAASRAPVVGPSQVPLSCHLSGLGQSQAPATSRKQGLPEAPPFLPAAPSPAQLPMQPLSLTPALGTHRGGPHVAASTPLPVTLVLTAQGLLSVPMPAMVGLSKPAATSDPKGLLVTLSPSLTETQAGQGLVNTGADSEPRSRTDLVTLLTPLPSQSPAEVDSDGARASGGPSSPGEAQVAGETASQAALLADDPAVRPNQLPPHGGDGPGGTPGSPSVPGETRGPPDLERQPPPRLGPEKGALDLGLLSQESEVAVREWLRGQRGVCVPPLRSRLPYQPPSLCSLRALSGLLLHKKALEHRASTLVVPGGAAGAPQASVGQLQHSPAYLLLKARFLATFTLPALLATLSPHGVPTTLSAAMRADPESEDTESEDDGVGQLELSAGHRQPGCWASGSLQEGPVATSPAQVGGRAHTALTPLPCSSQGTLACPQCVLPRVWGVGLGPEQVEVVAGRDRWWVSGEEEAGAQPAWWRVGGAAVATPFGQCGNWGGGTSLLTWGDPQLLLGLPAMRPCQGEIGLGLQTSPTHTPLSHAGAGSPAEGHPGHALVWMPHPSRCQLWHHPRPEAF